jgi:hypothetical protein
VDSKASAAEKRLKKMNPEHARFFFVSPIKLCDETAIEFEMMKDDAVIGGLKCSLQCDRGFVVLGIYSMVKG